VRRCGVDIAAAAATAEQHSHACKQDTCLVLAIAAVQCSCTFKCCSQVHAMLAASKQQ
jgi:hypothetical protein